MGLPCKLLLPCLHVGPFTSAVLIWDSPSLTPTVASGRVTSRSRLRITATMERPQAGSVRAMVAQTHSLRCHHQPHRHGRVQACSSGGVENGSYPPGPEAWSAWEPHLGPGDGKSCELEKVVG